MTSCIDSHSGQSTLFNDNAIFVLNEVYRQSDFQFQPTDHSDNNLQV